MSRVPKELAERRTQNVRRLINTSGLRFADFCRTYELEPNYLNQVYNGTKVVGDIWRDRIEKALGLPPGALDRVEVELTEHQARLERIKANLAKAPSERVLSLA